MSKRPATTTRPGDPGTTGHSWDGIEEFNNPLPRWWLWIFYATIIWAVIYSVAYPAWPLLTRATPGVLGHSTRADVAAEIARFDDANGPIKARLIDADLAAVTADADLMGYAMNAGAAVFRTHCAQCHGAGAAGVQAAGYPNLLDDDWLWGGTVEEIAYTVRHGIRNTADPDAHFSQMPAFAEILEPAQIDAVVQHVRAISGQEHDAGQAAEGAVLYAENCASCHGEAGLGDPALGAPNLADAIWLYGGDVAALTRSVAQARYGVMPNWGGRLSEDEIRAVALYVHGLGGGQ